MITLAIAAIYDGRACIPISHRTHRRETVSVAARNHYLNCKAEDVIILLLVPQWDMGQYTTEYVPQWDMGQDTTEHVPQWDMGQDTTEHVPQ